jgi:tagaturonate reductase
MKLRNVPLLLKHYRNNNTVPENMALGFAAYLLFMKCKPGPQGQYQGEVGGQKYTIQDETAPYFSRQWETGNMNTFVHDVLSNKDLWDTDLSVLNGFEEAVKENLQLLRSEGAAATLMHKQTKTVA